MLSCDEFCQKNGGGQAKSTVPFAPFPSASGFGGVFGCLNTFSEGIWSTRELQVRDFDGVLLVSCTIIW